MIAVDASKTSPTERAPETGRVSGAAMRSASSGAPALPSRWAGRRRQLARNSLSRLCVRQISRHSACTFPSPGNKSSRKQKQYESPPDLRQHRTARHAHDTHRARVRGCGSATSRPRVFLSRPSAGAQPVRCSDGPDHRLPSRRDRHLRAQHRRPKHAKSPLSPRRGTGDRRDMPRGLPGSDRAGRCWLQHVSGCGAHLSPGRLWDRG